MADLIDFERALAVLRQAESGNKSIRGPEVKYPSGKVDYPYGLYQVMGANIPSWTKEVLGQEYTPDQFLADEDAQHRVAKAKFTQFANQHSLQDAYAIWASGRPLSKSGENKDIVFGTRVKDTVAARMAQYNKGRNMADVPNMLEMPRPTVGDVASPSPFYQDAPPAGQDEFNSRYQEALGFLKSPEWKAAALQMAIAAIQPRAPGQTVFGHLANAVGQGTEAAGRAGAIAEEQRRAGVKEQLQQDELGLKRQEVEGRQKLQEGQLKLQEGQLSIQQATLARMTEQNQIAWKRLDLDRDRMDKEMAKIDAEIKGREGRERIGLLANVGKMRSDLLKNAQERLQLLHPERNKAEYQGVQAEISRHQSELERITGEYEKALTAIAPGAVPEKPTTSVKPVDVPIDDERMLRQARENPELFQKAITEGIPVGGRMVRFKLTEEQKQTLEDAPRVIPRPPNNTLGSDIKEGAGRVLKALQGSVLGDPEERQVGELKAAPMLKGKPVTPETFKTLSKEDQAVVRQQIETALPDKENMPKSPEAWKAIFESPLMERAARALYTDKVVDQIKKDLTDMTPREGKKKAAKTRELDKAFER